MWEFRNRNVFGATAFSTYGGFWLGLGLWVLLVANPAVAAVKPSTLATTVTALNHDLGWILLVFAIFNTYMLILSTQVNVAVFAVFLTLELTEIVLCIGNFNAGAALLPTGTIKVGGYIGLITALVAWYTSAALASRGMAGRLKFPVGGPLIS
jgi:succinate-acetate transporter protein